MDQFIIYLGEFIIDCLTISSLHISAYIGVYAWEQHIKQPLLIDLCMTLDLSQCNDHLDKTVDYALLCEEITLFVESKPFHLIETVAEEVALLVKKKYPGIHHLKISVSKPKAIKNAANVMVTLER